MGLVPGESPSYSDFDDRGTLAFGSILKRAMLNRGASQAYGQGAYDRIAGQTKAAESAVKDQAATGLGFNSTPQTGALQGMMRQNAPYASASMAAKAAGTQQTLQLGQAMMAKKAANASWWTSMMQPYLQEQSLELQEQQIENAAAMGLAGMGGGSGSSGTTNALIGAAGSLGAAALIAFA